MLFENCIAQSSWTTPSVVSLFTGVYPQQHGVNSLGYMIPESLSTLQEIMEENGMITAAFITNDFLKANYGYARGFNYFFDHYLQQVFKEKVASRLFFFQALLFFKNELFYPDSIDKGATRWWSIGYPLFNHERISAERVTDDVIQWINDHRDRHFYIYAHYMDVHEPYDANWYPLFNREAYPSQNEKEKRINVYDGRIAYLDRQIKRIWKKLVEDHLSDRTILIVTGDHGEELYDHDGTGHCTTLYDELLKVPLILINPSFPYKGQRVTNQIQLIALSRTVFDLLGLRAPEQMKGHSLFPLGKDFSRQSESLYSLSYTTRGRRSLSTERGRLLWEKKIWDQGIVLTSLRVDNTWKIIVGSDGESQLYNLNNDKEEQQNLIGIDRFVAEDLKEKMTEITSTLKSLAHKLEKQGISDETRNRLRALGYVK
jgi:arylsulfatase A-like enzyme